MSTKRILPIEEAFAELERGVYAALETYSNVHRGSGHNSMVTNHLFEQAREIVLEYLDLNKRKFVVIFCTPGRAAELIKQLRPGSYQMMSSQEIGLSLSIRALAVQKKSLPGGTPFQTGGGTTKLISQSWVIWASAPDKFEAGTPAIVNVIAFARALQLMMKYGNNIFRDSTPDKMTASEILYQDQMQKYQGQKLLDELRQTLTGRNIKVPTEKGDRSYVHLDNSASTPTFDPIWNAFRQTWRQHAQVKQDIIHEVRSICTGALGAPPEHYDVIFTSNTTESINLTAKNLGRESEGGIEPVVLSSYLEHSSNDLPWRMVPGCSLIRLSIDTEGFIDLDELDRVLCAYNQDNHYGKKRIRLVAVSGASNVLGTCNKIEEIGRIAQQYGALLLVDGAQLVAHRKVDMEASGIDYFAFSAHKVYAPFGCGVLVVRKGLLNFSSAELELIQSSGEENPGGIAALGKALVLLQRIGMNLIQKEEQALTGRALNKLSQITGLEMYGIKDPDSPRFPRKLGVIVFGLKNILPDKVARELAMRGGIGVRYGCHCAHILIKRILKVSPSLERFQRVVQTLFPKLRFPGLVRVSLGIENNEEDIDALIHAMNEIAGQIRSSANKHTDLKKAQVQKQMNDFTRISALKVYSQLPSEL